MKFDELGLRAELIRALAARGYDTPTPVQARAIPAVLEGRDVLAGAQTGTGKTAGFALPILHLLAKRQNRGQRLPLCLVLAPTRELADQVAESFTAYGKHLPLRVAAIYGGVGFNPQADAIRRGLDILVATPGRLLDHLKQRTLDLSKLEILVLDEADRMLDMGFIPDIRRILKFVPEKRQTLFFSATYSEEIRRLAEGMLQNPVEVEVAPRNKTADLVDQAVYMIDQKQKRSLLSHLIREGDWRQVLVFTRTKHGANRLAKQLNSDGVTAMPIHGNKSQSARTAALSGFKAGTVRALIATDIASRGLDISQLPHVVNYELPNVPEDYVHRIGRTGRAGNEGRAISLVSPDEVKLLRGIERLIRREVERLPLPEFERSTSEPADDRPPLPPRQNQRPRPPRSKQPEATASTSRDGKPRPPRRPRPARSNDQGNAGGQEAKLSRPRRPRPRRSGE